MTAPVDPNAPVQQVGETAANFRYRQQDYSPPASGPSQAMAKQWLDLCTSPSAPRGFTIL